MRSRSRGGVVIAGGESSGAARRVADRLVGLEIPSVILGCGWEHAVDLYELARQSPLVIYTYPGCSSSSEDDGETVRLDVAQHRAFREHQRDLEAHNYSAVGVSSQSKESQRQAALAGRVSHRLLCDPELELARALGLPTFMSDGAGWYERLVLVASGGRVEKAFYPVSKPARSAAQVITWLALRGVPYGVGDAAG